MKAFLKQLQIVTNASTQIDKLIYYVLKCIQLGPQGISQKHLTMSRKQLNEYLQIYCDNILYGIILSAGPSKTKTCKQNPIKKRLFFFFSIPLQYIQLKTFKPVKSLVDIVNIKSNPQIINTSPCCVKGLNKQL